MDAAELKARAQSVARGVKNVREHLRKSPALEIVAAVAIGFLAGMAMRAFQSREK